MPGQERFVALALAFQGLQFTGHIHFAVSIVEANVQRDDPDRIPRNQEGILLRVVERESKDATEFLQEIRSLVPV